MKNILVTLYFSIAFLTLNAQSPQAINYQAIARNSSGNPIIAQPISIRISILQESINGNLVYTEVHQTTTSLLGLFILKIGNGIPENGVFANINWGISTHYLKIEIDPTGGTNYQTFGTTQILSVPYALYANIAGKIIDGEKLNVYYVSKNSQIIDHSDINIDSSLAWTVNLASITSGVVILRGNHTYSILDDLTIPENVTIEFYPSAILNVESGAAFHLMGFLDAPDNQIFSGNGSFLINRHPYIRPQWFGAKGDGINDDTNPIRKAMESAAQMYNQTGMGFPPAGNHYAPPIVLFKPGCYRVTDEIIVYNGLTVSGEVANPFTVGHTRLIMDLIGNNNTIFKPSSSFQGQDRTNNATYTIQDLEFWFVTVQGSIIEPAGINGTIGPSYGNNIDGTPQYNGCAIKISEQCLDVRIKRCNFFQSPYSSILLTNDEEEPTENNRSIHIDECEFDTGNRFIRGENVSLDLTINSCTFYSGSAQIDIYNCSGDIIINSSRFDFNPHVVIQESNLNSFHFVGNHHTNYNLIDSISGGFITIDNAKIINISSNTFDKIKESTIHIISCKGGVVSNNAINNSGINTENTAPNINFISDLVPAAIRLSGCKNIIVSGNSISTTETGATFGGFGIYTRDYLSNSQGNYIFGNLVSGNYNGQNWNGQNRKVNVDPGDTKAQNL
jgi:hypothetical protein